MEKDRVRAQVDRLTFDERRGNSRQWGEEKVVRMDQMKIRV